MKAPELKSAPAPRLPDDLASALLSRALSDGLSAEQINTVSDVVQGLNVCVTGNAGTGKSHLLNWLRQNISIAVTASTGIAAIQVKGATIHSWAGLGRGDKTPNALLVDLLERQERYRDGTLRRIAACQTLVIDEISMLSDKLFTLLDDLFQLVRQSDAPFGGCQLVVFGDFLQLPPVSREGKVGFAFESPSWVAADFRVRLLTKTFRQQDQSFANILHKIRLDECDASVQEFLQARHDAVDPNPAHRPVVLHTHNAGCQMLNLSALDVVTGDKIIIPTQDSAKGNSEALLKELDGVCLAPAQLRIKIGARVMLLVNLDLRAGLANGSLGTVIDFGKRPNDLRDGEMETCVTVAFDNGVEEEVFPSTWEVVKGEEVVAKRRQIPLRLAYSITVHKSQGMTLDKIETHLEKVFEPGQSYVALSRARTAEGVFIRGNAVVIRAHPKAVQFYRSVIVTE